MASESVAMPIETQLAMRKIYAAMGSIKVARHALRSKDMSEVDEDVCDSLDGVFELLDQAYSHLTEVEA